MVLLGKVGNMEFTDDRQLVFSDADGKTTICFKNKLQKHS